MKSTIKNGIVYLKEAIEDKENGYKINTIDLNKLVDKKVAADSEIDGIRLESTFNTIRIDENKKITLEYILEYTDETPKLTLTGKVKTNGDELFSITCDIDIDTLIMQIVDSISKNNRNINVGGLEIMQKALDKIKDQAYKAAFKNNILLAEEEFNYRINVYKANSDSLIGIANRLFITKDIVTLMEFIAFDAETQINTVDIQMVIDDQCAIYMKDLSLHSESGKSIKYCAFRITDGKIAIKSPSRGEVYNPEKLKLKGLKLPYKNSSTKYLLEELMRQNDHGALIRCYKQNKSINIVKINVNKYLLG